MIATVALLDVRSGFLAAALILVLGAVAVTRAPMFGLRRVPVTDASPNYVSNVARSAVDFGAEPERGRVGVERAPVVAQTREEHAHRRRLGGEDRGRESLEHLGIGRPAAEPLEQARHRRAAQRVVGHDRLVGNTEQAEHDRGEHAGAVLARAAVEHRGKRVGLRHRRDRRPDRRRAGVRHAQVGVADVHRFGPLAQFDLVGQHVGHREVVHHDVADVVLPAPALLGLVDRAEVDDRRAIRVRRAAAHRRR